MIAGIGLDIVDVAAFAAQLADPASVFATTTFTDGERQAADKPGDRAHHLAVRWAAKEAFVKAWSGTRRGQPPSLQTLDWRDIEVVQDPFGRPTVVLHGQVARLCGRPQLHVSLSHDGNIAAAVVVWEELR